MDIQGNVNDWTNKDLSNTLSSDSNRTVIWISDHNGFVALVTTAPHSGTTTVWCEDTIVSSASGGDNWSRTNYFYVVRGKQYMVRMDGNQGSVVSWILYL
jgi:hypothetical protein